MFLGVTCNGGVLGVLSKRFFELCDASHGNTEQTVISLKFLRQRN